MHLGWRRTEEGPIVLPPGKSSGTFIIRGWPGLCFSIVAGCLRSILGLNVAALAAISAGLLDALPVSPRTEPQWCRSGALTGHPCRRYPPL